MLSDAVRALMDIGLHMLDGHTRLSIGKAMHRCATTPDCVGGCVLVTQQQVRAKRWVRDGEGRWVRR